MEEGVETLETESSKMEGKSVLNISNNKQGHSSYILKEGEKWRTITL